MSEDCIFCKIAKHLVPTTILYESERVIAFNDLHPDAPVHVLIIPKQHLSSLAKAEASDQPVLGEILLAATQVARIKQIDQTGFRCIINVGKQGGQVIPHLHLHLLGGQSLGPLIQKDLSAKP